MQKRTSPPEPAPAQEQGRDRLFLDKEGRWFHEGVEITHRRTLSLFSKSIRRDPSGKYYVHVGPESAEVAVEDAPYTITSVTIQEEPGGIPQDYILHLNDETRESLESGPLVVSEENVMYCRVKGGSERARFLRAAYYQICVMLRYDETDDRYWLPRRDGKISIRSVGEPQVEGTMSFVPDLLERVPNNE